MLPDVFASNVVFLISAVYIGGLPVADHVIRKPGNTRITGADAGRIIFGGADDKHKKQNKIRISLYEFLDSPKLKRAHLKGLKKDELIN